MIEIKKLQDITNPIYEELKKLKLIKNSNLFFINNKTRDRKIKVIKDKKSNIIFLEKLITNINYYSLLKYLDNDRKKIKQSNNKTALIKTLKGNIRATLIEDDKRRVRQFEKIIYNKDILDFGCGWCGFLRNIKNYKSLNGIELREECINYIKKNVRRIKISNNINFFKKKFDVITLFHVLEHIPHQVKTLKMLKKNLKKKGKIIIEVPHAKDFLILQNDLKKFKDFTFWSEHLILHTYNSLKTILLKAGFKKIEITFYQRYNLSNHLGWFINGKPNGHKIYQKIISKNLNQSYCDILKKAEQTDTLIAIAE